MPAVVTVKVLPVAFVLHLIVPLQLLAVNIAVWFGQIADLSATTVGAFGLPPVVITAAFEAKLVPQVFWQVAV